MTDMIDLQRSLVADHIADLEREAAALRAERDRDQLEASAAVHHDGGESPTNPRTRLGRWLIGVGEALGGSTRAAAAGAVPRSGSPCDDAPRGLSTAA
jgi:hypothetical protein